MSETGLSTGISRRSTRAAVGGVAVLSAGLAAALAAWGTFSHGSTPHPEPLPEAAENNSGDYLIVLGIIGVTALVVFGWIVPRALRSEAQGTTALVLSAIGLLTVAVFWSGLPPVLAGAGIFLGWTGRNAAKGGGLAWTAIAIGVAAIGFNLLIAVTGAT